MTGSASTSAQEMTCQPPSRRESARPRHSRGRRRRIAATISRSPASEAKPLFASAKPATDAAPTTENSQKAGFGRSPPRMTPKIAVASGKRPTNTIECAAVMCWSASAVSNGKPTTTPSATTRAARDRRARGASRAAASSSAAPSSAAMTARAEVRNSGVKSPTATRVAGSEPLKMMTPRRPLPHPCVVRCRVRRHAGSRSSPRIAHGRLPTTATHQYGVTEQYG